MQNCTGAEPPRRLQPLPRSPSAARRGPPWRRMWAPRRASRCGRSSGRVRRERALPPSCTLLARKRAVAATLAADTRAARRDAADPRPGGGSRQRHVHDLAHHAPARPGASTARRPRAQELSLALPTARDRSHAVACWRRPLTRAAHARAQVSRVAKMLADEFGTASNIKNRVNRQARAARAARAAAVARARALTAAARHAVGPGRNHVCAAAPQAVQQGAHAAQRRAAVALPARVCSLARDAAAAAGAGQRAGLVHGNDLDGRGQGEEGEHRL